MASSHHSKPRRQSDQHAEQKDQAFRSFQETPLKDTGAWSSQGCQNPQDDEVRFWPQSASYHTYSLQQDIVDHIATFHGTTLHGTTLHGTVNEHNLPPAFPPGNQTFDAIQDLLPADPCLSVLPTLAYHTNVDAASGIGSSHRLLQGASAFPTSRGAVDHASFAHLSGPSLAYYSTHSGNVELFDGRTAAASGHRTEAAQAISSNDLKPDTLLDYPNAPPFSPSGASDVGAGSATIQGSGAPAADSSCNAAFTDDGAGHHREYFDATSADLSNWKYLGGAAPHQQHLTTAEQPDGFQDPR